MKTFISLSVFLIPFLSGIFISVGSYNNKIIFSILGYIFLFISITMYYVIRKGMEIEKE